MENLEEKAINGAIQSGLKELIGRNKYLFSGMEDYLTEHLNEEKLKAKISELGREIKEKKIGVMGPAFLYNGLKKYVASGAMFDVKGEEKLLKRGIGKQAEKAGIFYRIKNFFEYLTKPREQKYFERTLKDANEIYYSIKSDKNLEEINPQYAAYMRDMNALYPLIQLMKDKKIITKSEAKILYEKSSKGLEEKTAEFKQVIGKRLEKIAASILGIAGIFLIITSSKITGAVIGVSKNVISSFIGIFLVFGALLLFNLSRKKIKK